MLLLYIPRQAEIETLLPVSSLHKANEQERHLSTLKGPVEFVRALLRISQGSVMRRRYLIKQFDHRQISRPRDFGDATTVSPLFSSRSRSHAPCRPAIGQCRIPNAVLMISVYLTTLDTFPATIS